MPPAPAADAFLRATDVIDWQHPTVTAAAAELCGGLVDVHAIAERCFTWVRDEIKHSMDFALVPVPCAASEVLRDGSGFCYAKSHLLAALLRANGIPAGLCYQRLATDHGAQRFCLHGFNAVWLPATGWYRVDPRGNRPGVDARFTPPIERLAFSPRLAGEADLPGVCADPWPVVVAALRAHGRADELAAHLPDIPWMASQARP